MVGIGPERRNPQEGDSPQIHDSRRGDHASAAPGRSANVGAYRPRNALQRAGVYMDRYLGPLPPSRGVQRGPSTSVALQSTQLGGFTRSSSPTRS
jgi:hypothetical protein